jgi:nucleoid DNA-binding protein
MADVITRDSLAEQWKAKVEADDGGVYAMSRARDDVRWFFDTISQHLARGQEVRVHGFGNFKVMQRAARMGRNPQTGAPVPVPAHKVVRFAASTGLNASLAASKGHAKR